MLTAKNVRGLTAAMGNGVLANSAGANSNYSISTTFPFAIDGKYYSRTSTTTAAPTTDYNTGSAFTALAASKGCVFVWAVNSSSAVKVMQGPVADLDGVASSDLFKDPEKPQFPYIPDDVCPFAYSVVRNKTTGSAWTFGSSNFNATGITIADVNVATLPTRPQSS